MQGRENKEKAKTHSEEECPNKMQKEARANCHSGEEKNPQGKNFGQSEKKGEPKENGEKKEINFN